MYIYICYLFSSEPLFSTVNFSTRKDKDQLRPTCKNAPSTKILKSSLTGCANQPMDRYEPVNASKTLDETV